MSVLPLSLQILFLAVALPSKGGQATTAEEAPRAPPPITGCDRPEHRQFDFWVGAWDVIDRASGSAIGINRIERLYGGCVLREDFTAPGFTGGSFNAWSQADGRWHQTWMDQSGAVRHFAGGLDRGRIVLIAEVRDPRNLQAATRIRMTLSPGEEGTVRHHSDLSRDGGRTWQLRYDYLYRKRD